MIAIPVAQLNDNSFWLSTRPAGEIVQKFANYRLRLAVVGDISKWILQSEALQDFVYEANNEDVVGFAANTDELYRRLGSEVEPAGEGEIGSPARRRAPRPLA